MESLSCSEMPDSASVSISDTQPQHVFFAPHTNLCRPVEIPHGCVHKAPWSCSPAMSFGKVLSKGCHSLVLWASHGSL
jgi:hypothetical protein